MQIFNNANYNFIRWRWQAIAFSAAVVVAGVALMVTRGMPLGIDFSGGTQLIAEFSQPVTEESVREAVAPLPGDEVVQQYDDPARNQYLVRLCGGPLARECKSVVPELQGAVIEALAHRRGMERARNAVTEKA